ncbi:G patch domain-containing protein 4 [Aulostomus maculatus]
MAEVVQEKSRGLKFAEQQLKRHGWEHGKGLGRDENGISEAIKVKVKCDKGGVGHKEGEQFTFHWWDHVFNKASSSLQVESDQNGISLKKTVEEGEGGGTISNKKPRKASLAKAKLYGCFVKSATLLCGQEQPELKSSDAGDDSGGGGGGGSSDEEDDQRLDLSSSTKLSDADLMKACGGRTAHKGARHGLTMSAKLARLEQQEAEFMAKYGKKNHAPRDSVSAQTSQSHDHEDTAMNPQRKKTKKKKSSEGIKEVNSVAVSEIPEIEVTPKKKKKKVREEISDDAVAAEVSCVEHGVVDHNPKITKKRKKKNKRNGEESSPLPNGESECPETTDELQTDTKVKKKKKKSHRHLGEAAEESGGPEASGSKPLQDSVSKISKRKSAVVTGVDCPAEQERKKYKRDKVSVEDNHDGETIPPEKKKKKKKSKQ